MHLNGLHPLGAEGRAVSGVARATNPGQSITNAAERIAAEGIGIAPPLDALRLLFGLLAHAPYTERRHTCCAHEAGYSRRY